MKKAAIITLLLFVAGFTYAQTRDDIMIYIPMPTGGTATEQSYFKENFEMETIAAGYATTENSRDADYTLRLEVKPNMVVYDDGTEELAPPEEKQSLLDLRLVRNEDGVEIVSFSFPFTAVEEMYDFNLYLLYQAMANVPLTKLTAILDTDHWRNKWLYIRASFDYPITFYALLSPDHVSTSSGAMTADVPLNHEIRPYPGATLGLEFQFLNWMSVEGDFQVTFGDPFTSSLVPVIGFEVKFPLKPSKHFMLEPYVAAMFPATTISEVLQFPRVGIGGGAQLGVKGGSMGAFFVDLNYIHYLGDVVVKSPYTNYTPDRITYSRFVIGLGLGYKIGFFNRNKDPVPSK
jgi:hypothetical protein